MLKTTQHTYYSAPVNLFEWFFISPSLRESNQSKQNAASKPNLTFFRDTKSLFGGLTLIRPTRIFVEEKKFIY